MPAPPINQAPFDTVEYVLQTARVLGGDAIQSLDGQLLSDAQPYTFALLNRGWKRLRQRAALAGVQSFYTEAILTGIPPNTSGDPSSQAYVSWSECYDGLNVWPAPVLPQSLVIPLRLWERPTGACSSGFAPMRRADDGLPTIPQGSSLRWWEFREDRINFVGAQQATDIRIRGQKRLPDLPSLPDAPVPVVDCSEALAWFTLWAFEVARGSALAETCEAAGEREIQVMLQPTAREKQRQTHQRGMYGEKTGLGRGLTGW